MKRQLTLRLLREAISESILDEDRFREITDDLEILARLKYDRYEMFQPGRLFFENLYAWLRQFERDEERLCALEFVHEQLIFISREEFEQLTQVVYHDRIRQKQFDIVSQRTGIDRFRVKQIAGHNLMKRIQRSSLYVAMSDGARIDYLRRQNLDITNEQVLQSYDPSEAKVKDLLRQLDNDTRGNSTKFDCLFLIDDFVASGRTLLRETLNHTISEGVEVVIPEDLKTLLKWDPDERKMSLVYSESGLTDEQKLALSGWAENGGVTEPMAILIDRYDRRQTNLTGSLIRFSHNNLLKSLNETGNIFLCPLLITEYALNRLSNLMKRAENDLLRSIEILPGAIVRDEVRLTSSGEGMADICEKYYSDDLGDDHTGNVMYGYDACGLPVVLHHNTPNNSIYPLWSRKWKNPLFARYERHGRKARKHA